MKYVLYGYWRSSCSYRVRIALELKGLEYTYKPVHLVKDGGQQHDATFREKNPMGQVPYFYDEENKVGLSQSSVIIDYIEAMHPTPSLFPESLSNKLLVRQFCEVVNSGIQPLQNLAVLQTIERLYEASQGDKAAWAASWIARGFEALERMVSPVAGAFCFGDTPGAADAFLVPQVYGAHRFGVDMDAYPNLKRINENCLALEAFQKAEPAAQPDAQ